MRLKLLAKDSFYRVVPPALSRHILRALPGQTPFRDDILAKDVIFIHVPKAAGTSIKTALYSGHGGGHRRIAEYYGYDPVRAAASFKFGFVRNPWSRLLSAYNFLMEGTRKSGRDRRFAAAYLAGRGDFTAFVTALETPAYRRAVLSYDHFQPQRYWICLPRQAAPALDFMGRYESYAADLEQLNARLGLPLDPGIRARAAGQKIDYREAYTQKTRQIVADLYAGDIAALGYDF